MAKQIDIVTGVEKAAAALEGRQHAESSRQWRDLRNKLDTMLLSTSVMKTNEVRQQCLLMDTMTTDERRTHIEQYWGQLYREKAEPIILQLQALEAHIAKSE